MFQKNSKISFTFIFPNETISNNKIEKNEFNFFHP